MLHRAMSRFHLTCTLAVLSVAAQAQVVQLTRDQLIEFTRSNPFERSADGRPKVPDDLLKKLQDVSAEEIWTILHKHG